MRRRTARLGEARPHQQNPDEVDQTEVNWSSDFRRAMNADLQHDLWARLLLLPGARIEAGARPSREQLFRAHLWG